MSASRLIVSSAASSASNLWASSANLSRFQSASSRCFSQAVRQTVSKEERVALRAARRERANKLIYEQTGVEGSADAASSGATKRIMASKWSIYAAVGVPSALLAWGVSDANSPPAQFSRLIGLSGLIESLSDEYVKPAHNKLLPDWSQVCL
jgi:hypothetical protein